MLPHVVLEVTTQVPFEQLTLPDYVVTSASHHLRNPGEEFVQSIVFNHAVELADVF